MKDLLIQSFQKLERRLEVQRQRDSDAGGVQTFTHIDLKIVGQVALLLSDLPFPITSTTDIDILHRLPYDTTKALEKTLLDIGLILETDHRLIWMPAETTYHSLFQGAHITASYADPFFVIASKCKFQRKKDRALIATYCNHYPDTEAKLKNMEIDTQWITQL